MSPRLSVAIAWLTLGLALAGSLLLGLRWFGPSPAAPEPLGPALEGVWVHVGEPGDIRVAPSAGGRMKFRVANRWTLTSAHARTGAVNEHFGGTWRVNGGVYVETIDYSVDENDPELGNTLTFSVKIDADTMTQVGLNNPYTEVWKRVR